MDLMEKYLSRVKLDRKMYKIYSKILGDHLWLVPTDREMRELVAEGIQGPVYTHDEITKLEGISKEGLKKIHNVKKVFPGATVEDIRREGF